MGYGHGIRVLTVTFLFFVLAVALGCRQTQVRTERASAPSPPVVPSPASPQDAIAAALHALQVPGIPEPPLKPGVTRAEREAYLLATSKAVEAMRSFATFDSAPKPAAPTLAAPNRTEEVAALAPVLAVELADAIDRSDPARASSAIRAALSYADYVTMESVSGGLTAGTVADYLANAIRTTPKQIDATMYNTLSEWIDEFKNRRNVANASLQAEISRLKEWLGKMDPEGPPVAVEAVLHTVRESGMRKPVPPEASEALARFARKHSAGGDTLPARVVVEEAKIAIDLAVEMLENLIKESPKPPEWPVIKVEEHPIASLYFSIINPYSNQAGDVGKLREEGLMLVELAVKLSHLAELPADLNGFGEGATSPYNGRTYVFRHVEGGYELARPREDSAKVSRR